MSTTPRFRFGAVPCRYGVGLASAGQAPAKGRLAPVRVLRLAALRRRADPGGLRRPRACRGEHLRRRGLGPAGHERAVPPRDLASGAQALDEAARSLDDLRTDRRDLYARGTARAEGHACE